ncbi:polysaccharide deacetylase family protein [Geminisphaera colitermitum]|uniref:polysaccharide deacetylase family protein n=1 Tax=Geminisphaera colitermitum TaxID=1148786 RepID=UPI000158C608|nr:polysaccharide deacetylase family protein [Geminisphaera colitermitum]
MRFIVRIHRHCFLFILAAMCSWLPMLSASSAATGSRQTITLAPGEATGGERVALDDGRSAVSLPAASDPNTGYKWRLPAPLPPGWWEMTVEFAKRPKDSSRIKFFFGTPLAPVFDLTDAENAWGIEQFRLRLWCTAPLASLEVRPQRHMPETIRAIKRVTFAPVDGPAPSASADATANASIAPRMLGLLVETTTSALPSGLPPGNWQISPAFRFPAAVRGTLSGAMTVIGADGERITAPMSRRVNVYLDQAPVSLEWPASVADNTPPSPAAPGTGLINPMSIKGAVLQSVPLYQPRLPLDRKNAPLPVASPDRRTLVTLSFATGTGVSDIKRQVALPLLPCGAQTAVVTSWDDGAANDQRCAAALEKHGFHGTFFLMNNQAGRADFLAELERRGMEVASHSLNHPHAWTIAPGLWAAECLQMRLRLEAALGHPVISFAYPYNHVPACDARGDYVLRGVREAGYLSGRTTRTGGETITGYAEPLALVTDAHFLASPDRLEQAWQRAVSQPGGVFYFWGHSYEIRTEADWQKFDAFLARYGRQPGAWYATQGQLFLWRWLRDNVRIDNITDTRNGQLRVTLSWPELDRWLAKQVPLTVQVPADVARVTIEAAGTAPRELPATDGLVTLPADLL